MTKKKNEENEKDSSKDLAKAIGHLANKDHVKNSPVMDQLIESTRVMELVKSQFGYSGYSNPNYIALEKTIEANKKIIDGNK